MKVVECIFASSVYATLKRVLETLLEGTERARLTFQPNSDTPVLLHAIDALWVCNTRIGFKRHCFDRYRVTRDVSLDIDIKVWHDFLRNCKQSRRIKLLLELEADPFGQSFTPMRHSPEQLKLINCVPQGGGESVPLYHWPDNAPYAQPLPERYLTWPHFSIQSQELSNMVLDLAVGGMEVAITVHPNGDIALHSDFDMGHIEFSGYSADQHPIFQTHQAPPTCLTSEHYIVKYLKLVCSLAVLTSKVKVYVTERSDLVVELGVHDHITCVSTIRPYTGPRDVVLPENYRKFSTRST